MEDGGQGWKVAEDAGLDDVREDTAEDMGLGEGVREDLGEFLIILFVKNVLTNKTIYLISNQGVWQGVQPQGYRRGQGGQ